MRGIGVSLAAVLALFAATGCTSIESTYVAEPRDGSCYKGLPIVAEKPKWRIVRTKQVTYGLISKNEADSKTVLSIDRTWDERRTEAEVVNKSYMFAVDVKRPFAGTAKWDFDFPEPHASSGRPYYYPTKVHGDVDDKTLSQVGETFKTVIGALKDAQLLGKPGTPTAGAIAADAGVYALREHLVRVDVYDMEACSPSAPEGMLVFSRDYPPAEPIVLATK